MTKKRIIIVNDEYLHAEITGNVLQSEIQAINSQIELNIDFATTAETAESKIQENSYDLCILDFILVRPPSPMDTIPKSIKACQKVIKAVKNSSSDSCPIVLSTTYFDTQKQAKDICQTLSIDGHIHYIDPSLASREEAYEIAKLLEIPLTNL